ncbi:MAG TPA: Crp/Fnr family transcriptional regulator [Gemmataceae bacterium]|jgi:CRP/FNR family transcriptional regulator|nr:Crp/Fnr family transcriptional regulator [Gemmataceae bacterium]
MAHLPFSYLFCGESIAARELHRTAARVVVPAGKTIFLEGERADSAFGLSEGTVRLFKPLPSGGRQIVALALPGEFLEMPTVERFRQSAAAIGEVELYRFPRDQLLALIWSSPKLMSLLLDFANRQLELAHDQVVMLGNGSAEVRILLFLAMWRDRIAALKPSQQYLPLPMMRQDIADFLGLRLETLSRALAKLEAKNVIRIVPKGVVLNESDQTAALPHL